LQAVKKSIRGSGDGRMKEGNKSKERGAKMIKDEAAGSFAKKKAAAQARQCCRRKSSPTGR